VPRQRSSRTGSHAESSAESTRRGGGLHAGEMARYLEAKVFYKSLIEVQKATDAELTCIWERVQPMTIESAMPITKALQELD